MANGSAASTATVPILHDVVEAVVKVTEATIVFPLEVADVIITQLKVALDALIAEIHKIFENL